MEVTGLSHVLQLNAEHSTHPSGCGGSRTREARWFLEPCLLTQHTLVGGRTPFASSRLAGFGVHVPRPSLSILLRVAWTTLLVVRRGLTRPLTTRRAFWNGACKPPMGVWAAASATISAGLAGVDNRQGFTSLLPQICGSPLDFPAGGLLAASLRALLSCRAKQGCMYPICNRLHSRVILFISIKSRNVNIFCHNFLLRLCQQILLKLHHPLIIRRIPRDIRQFQRGYFPPDDIDQPGEFS